MGQIDSFHKKFPPPNNFRPATNVQWAELTTTPSFAKIHETVGGKSPIKRKGVRADGLRYQAKVNKHLSTLFGDKYIAEQWVHFLSDGKEKYCQPDGFMLLHDCLIITETKLSHTANAWWQLKHLYLPVLRKIFSEVREVKLIEIVKWYDPHTKFPERFDFIEMESLLSSLPQGELFVHVWKGRG